jgi:magnesium chelatase family protein
VAAARQVAASRYAGTGYATNGEVTGHDLRHRWRATDAGRRLAERALARGVLTVRGLDRVLRVAWTICDLAGGCAPTAGHVEEALYLRAARTVTAA